MPYLVRCYPGVSEALVELRATGWRVGIVTNGMADNQLGKLQQTGLADAVNGYAVSGAEGIRKPESQLFHIAAERCGTNLAEGVWMVGDNLIADLQSAQAAPACARSGSTEGRGQATSTEPTTSSATSSKASPSCARFRRRSNGARALRRWKAGFKWRGLGGQTAYYPTPSHSEGVLSRE
ncbi:HAD family hydrolase [Nonomuraea dietziae]|uniref:HAD family hydrolase n=1 Tax=Nonomuraea dietziae TaxID=65515 RepID=UPI0033C21ECD